MKSRQLILDLLSATPSPREAKTFIKKFDNSSKQPVSLGWVRLQSGLNASLLNSFAHTMVSCQKLGLFPLVLLDMGHLHVNAYAEAKVFLDSEISRIAHHIQLAGGNTLNCYKGLLEDTSDTVHDVIQLAFQLQKIPIIAPIRVHDSKYQLVSSREALKRLIQSYQGRFNSKLLIINQRGGLTSQKKPLFFINLQEDLKLLLNEFKHSGQELEELETVQHALDLLPQNASAIITSAASSSSLIANLITEKPISKDSFLHAERVATLVRKGLTITHYSDLNSLDRKRLWNLLESSFSKKLMTEAFEKRLQKNLASILIAGDQMEGAAIITKEAVFI